MKDIHPKLSKCEFICATCASKFTIDTTIKATTYGIDICSKCHPFYIGKTTNKQLRGKAEKLQAKFDAGKANIAAKPETAKTKKAKVNSAKTSLDSL